MVVELRCYFATINVSIAKTQQLLNFYTRHQFEVVCQLWPLVYIYRTKKYNKNREVWKAYSQQHLSLLKQQFLRPTVNIGSIGTLQSPRYSQNSGLHRRHCSEECAACSIGRVGDVHHFLWTVFHKVRST